MKSKEVLKFLNISRVTLTKYVKNGTIKVTKLDNGYYDYDDKSVFAFAKKDTRYNYIYARVSTHKQKNDLDTQIKLIKKYCQKNNIHIDNTFSDIASGVNFDRNNFSVLLNDVLSYKVNKIYITNKDRLTRLSFKTLQSIFNKFGTEIIIINDLINKQIKTDENAELLEELINIIHLFSTKLYSKRKNSINKV